MTGDGVGKKSSIVRVSAEGRIRLAVPGEYFFQRVQLLREVVCLTGSAFFNSLKNRFSPRREDRKELMRVLRKR